jgi:hypothetical protein
MQSRRKGCTDRFRIKIRGEEFIPSFIHSTEIVHGSDEDVDFDGISQAAPSFLQDGSQVFQRLSLSRVNQSDVLIITCVNHTVCSFMPPSTRVEVFGSTPMLPEQYTIPLYLTACENCGRGLGAFEVKTPSAGAISANNLR